MAGLSSALLVMFIGWGTEVLFHVEPAEAVAYVIEVPETTSAQKPSEPIEQGPSLAELLAAASVEKGERLFKKCSQCHNVVEGGKNGTGPNLWNTVGEDIADASGFPYSSVMGALEGDWTYEKLDGFLKKPSSWLRGTKMSFAGLKKPADRAAIIKYLWVNGDQSDSLPQVVAAAE
ncbi:MAG: cytochrome c family protein [Pseudomonadota bacterium]